MGNTILFSLAFLLATAFHIGTSEEHIDKRSILSIKSKLLSMFGQTDDSFTNSIAALDDSLDILKCLPTKCSGNCCRSPTACLLPKLDKRPYYSDSRAYITLCKNPYKIRIDLKARLRSIYRLGRLNFSPIEIIFDHQKANGITIAKENSRVVSASLGPIRFLKVNLIFDLFVRWDCRRPTRNTRQRLKYNQMYGGPGNNMNKLFYKIKVRYEVKQKGWLFRYKCKSCRDVINKKKAFAEGPKSCKSDWGEWTRCTFFMGCEGISSTRQCIGQSAGGPPCQGPHKRPCARIRGGRRHCP